jgi:hypothetical protein
VLAEVVGSPLPLQLEGAPVSEHQIVLAAFVAKCEPGPDLGHESGLGGGSLR